jgi:hypothetical protein
VRATKPTPKTPKRTAGEWQPVFLATLRQHGNVRLACHAAGINRTVAYDHKAASAAFAAAWAEALADACDILEEIARQRALEMSDTLLIFLLKSHRPAVYRETYRHEVTDGQGGPLRLQVEVVDDRAPEPAALPPSAALVPLRVPYEVAGGRD